MINAFIKCVKENLDMKIEPTNKSGYGILSRKQREALGQHLTRNPDMYHTIDTDKIQENEEDLTTGQINSHVYFSRQKLKELPDRLEACIQDSSLLMHLLLEDKKNKVDGYNLEKERELKKDLTEVFVDKFSFFTTFLTVDQKEEIVVSILEDHISAREHKELVNRLKERLDEELERQEKTRKVIEKLQQEGKMEEMNKFKELLMSSYNSYTTGKEFNEALTNLYPSYEGKIDELENKTDKERREILYQEIPELKMRERAYNIINDFLEVKRDRYTNILVAISDTDYEDLKTNFNLSQESKYGQIVEILDDKEYLSSSNSSKGGYTKQVKPVCQNLEEKELIKFDEEENKWELTELGREVANKL